MKISAEVESIQKLKDFFFIVPDYQREYVWEADKHVSRFLQDINDEYGSGSDKGSNYFIGSAIIVERADGSFDVVDGQQRLTTIVISLCAMRMALREMNVAEPEENLLKEELLKLLSELLYKFDLSSLKHTPRLILQYEESKDYLSKLITELEFTDSLTPSIKRMKAAYTTVIEYLKEIQTEGELPVIQFIKYFLTNVELVIIKPDNLSSALKIFETINERGVGLNAMDLLKNLLFSNASEDDFKQIKSKWKEMLGFLDDSGDGDKPLRFLRYFLMGRYHNGIIREDEIYKWMISDTGKAKVKYHLNPVAFVNELKAAASKYNKFIKATNAWDADSTYPAIAGIGYLGKKISRQHLVLLLALKDNIDIAIINLLARNIESLMFYYSVNRTLTKSYEEKFANWAVKLRTLNSIEELRLFLQTDFSKEMTEQQTKFASQFASKSQFDLNPQYRVKYILGKMENYIRQKVNFPTANFSYYQNQQLEHILPQGGTNIPTAKYPQPYDYSNTVYRFGNLTLLEAPINQSLNFSNDISSNQWFGVKKAAYLNSTIFLSRTFSEIKIGEQTQFNGFSSAKLKTFDEWNMATVAERQEMMRKLMEEIWKLEL